VERQPAGQHLPRDRTLAFGETLRFIARERRAAYAVGVIAFCELAVRSLLIAGPGYLSGDLALERPQLVVIFAVGILGVVAGMAWTVRTFKIGDAHHVMRLALFGLVGTVAALLLVPVPVVAGPGSWLLVGLVILVALVLGASFSVAPVASRAVLSATAPVGHQARVFATQATVAHAVMVLPIVLTGLGTQYAGTRPTLVLLLGIGVVLVFALERVAGPFRLPPNVAARSPS
jgi:hypothetical protein